MEKPQPTRAPESQAFWQGCDREELLFQHCRSCGNNQYYPRPICVRCHGRDLGWLKSAGEGVVFSYTQVHRAPSEAFAGDVPYVIAVIDLAEGFRVVANILNAGDEVRIGSPVDCVFEQRGAHKLMQFRLRG